MANANGTNVPVESLQNAPPIVAWEQWERARQELLVREKELTRARDAMAAARRRMPWMEVEKEYVLDGPYGRVGLRSTSRESLAGRNMRAAVARWVLIRSGIWRT
jgi:predicted dithiol-disulfide oxidoreductase (DUF899 family)